MPGGRRRRRGLAQRRAPRGRHRRQRASTARSRPGCSTARIDAHRGRACRASGSTSCRCPGAFELPLGAMALAKTRRYACVVALGCVIRGDTPHFEYVAGEAASGLQLAGARDRRAGLLRRPHLRQPRAGGGARGRARRGTRAPRPRVSALEMADVLLARAFGRAATPISAGYTAPSDVQGLRSLRERSRRSETTGATRWWPRSGGSTRTSSAFAFS